MFSVPIPEGMTAIALGRLGLLVQATEAQMSLSRSWVQLLVITEVIAMTLSSVHVQMCKILLYTFLL